MGVRLGRAGVRRVVLGLTAVAVPLSGLSVVALPASASPVIVAAADPDGSLETPSRPLPSLPEPVDPAESIVGLPNVESALPDDGSSTVDPGSSWTQVPGLPLTVRADEETTVDPQVAFRTSDSGGVSDALARTDVTTDPAVDPADDTPAVDVSLIRPDQMAQGAFVLSFDDSASTSSPEASPTPSPEPSAGPSAAADPSGTPTASPTPGPTSDPSSGPSTTPSVDPSIDPSTAPGVPGADGVGGADVVGLDVRVNYKPFASLFGGGWAERLQVVAYPECFATTPELPECAQGVPIPAVSNPTTGVLSFTTISAEELAALTAGDASASTGSGTLSDSATPSPSPAPANGVVGRTGSMVAVPAVSVRSMSLAVQSVAATPVGGTVYSVQAGAGNYGATPLSPSTGWQVGTGSGEFSYSYPFELPTPTGGSAPSLALNYSSGSVDGMTFVENGQASPAGVGWSLNPGSVSRQYTSCAKDGMSAKGDLCWKTDGIGLVNDLTLVLGGRSSRLVKVGTTAQYRLADDPGWKVELISNGAEGVNNDDNNNEAFKVTSTDGTVYWFGKGTATGGAATESVWTVPVYGNNAGEPCYDSSKAASAMWCQQAWQWNLDQVIDPDGNVIDYTYTPETNYYSRYATVTNHQVYDRGGVLDKIEYSYDRATHLARAVVDVGHNFRCTSRLSDPSASCTGLDGPRAHPSIWPDVPGDLICDGNDNCDNSSPSFFSWYRYANVVTKTVAGNGTPYTVDTYTFQHQLPDPDGAGTANPDEPDLWLNLITRTGQTQSDSVTLPPVDFDGVALQNRVAVGTNDPRTLKKFRIGSLHNEAGGRLDIEYGHASGRACTATYVQTGGPNSTALPRYASDRECFPQKYTPLSGSERWEWFHKYVVTRVAASDDALGYRYGQSAQAASTVLGQLQVTDYDYQGAPAWRYVRSRNIPDADETWNDWRGYAETKIRTRKTTDNKTLGSDDESVRRVVVYRGMNNTKVNDGSTMSVVHVETEENATTVAEPLDLNFLQGRVAESELIDATGTWLTRTYHEYQYLESALDAAGQHAWVINDRLTRTHTHLFDTAGGPTDRIHEVWTAVEDGGTDHRGILAGAIKSVSDLGDPDGGADDRCQATEWTGNTSAWIRVPHYATSYGVACGSANLDANRLSKARYYYDNQESDTNEADPGSDIIRGRLTRTRIYTSPADTTTPETGLDTDLAYDNYGRLTSVTDPRRHTTSTVYNNGTAPNELITKVTVTSPLITSAANPNGIRLSSTTTLDPRRGLPTSVVDENGNTTTIGYDGLGRTATVDLPTGSSADSVIYTYTDSAINPTRVKSSVLRDGSTRDDSYTFYDGWGRPIETQVHQADRTDQGRLVSVTGYDDRGQVRFSMPAVANPNTTNSWTAPVNPDPNGVQRYTETTYDAAGRPIRTALKSQGTFKWASLTDYKGDRTITTPPTGGVTKTTTDRWGQPTLVRQFLGDGTGNQIPEDAVSYTYTKLGQLDTMAKIFGTGAGATTSTWDYDYDWAGRRTRAVDPDTGTTTTSYDADGNPLVVTTPTAQITTSYDWLNRPTHRDAQPVTDNSDTIPDDLAVVADWTYDGKLTTTNSLANGLGMPWTTTTTSQLGTFTDAVDGYDTTGKPTSVTTTFPGALTGYTNPVSKTTTVGYDQAGNVTDTTYPGVLDLGSLSVHTATTDYGLLKTMTVPGTPVKLAEADYNLYNQTTLLESTDGSTTPDGLAFVAANALERTYDYDLETGRLTSLSGTNDLVGTSSHPRLTYLSLGYAYDQVGSPLRVTTTARTAPTTPGGTTPGPAHTAAWCYHYDGLHRLTNATTGQPGTGATCDVDAQDQSVTGADYQLGYSYDQDHLTSVTLGTGTSATTSTYTTGYAADPGSKPIGISDGIHHPRTISAPSGGGAPAALPTAGKLTYDKAGRVFTFDPTADGKPTLRYRYDALSNVVTIEPVNDAGVTIDGLVTTSAYDASGIRLARKTANTTGTGTNLTTRTTTVTYLGPTEATRTVEHDSDPITTDVVTLSSSRHLATPAGTPIATQTVAIAGTNAHAEWTWLLADGQHNIRLTRTSTGTTTATDVTELLNYYPFGAPTPTIKQAGQLAALTPDTAAIGGDHGYLNHPHDPGGDVRLDHRNYTPTLNTLTTPDPLLAVGNPQSFNPYAYSGNNPIALSDPSGLGPTPEMGGSPCTGACEDDVTEQLQQQYPETFGDGGGDGGGDGDSSNTESTGANNQGTTNTVEHRMELEQTCDALRCWEWTKLEVELSWRVKAEHRGCYGGAWQCMTSMFDFATIVTIPLGGGDIAIAIKSGVKGGSRLVGGLLGRRAAANTGRLTSRADELSGALDPIARNSRTSAVLGTRQGRDVLAGGGRDLSPAQRALARDGDVIARGPGLHAEVTAVNGARSAGLTPQGIGVSRPICPACISFLEDAGATITSPFTAWWY